MGGREYADEGRVDDGEDIDFCDEKGVGVVDGVAAGLGVAHASAAAADGDGDGGFVVTASVLEKTEWGGVEEGGGGGRTKRNNLYHGCCCFK